MRIHRKGLAIAKRCGGLFSSRLISLLLLLLAVSVFVTVPIPSQAGADLPQEFRILTHNVYLLPGALGVGLRTRTPFIERSFYLRDYDVVILNELFDNDASDPLLEALSDEDQYPYQTPVVGRENINRSCREDENNCWNSTEGAVENIGSKVDDGGVAILSRWRIEERVQYIFHNACGSDYHSNKGFAYVRINVNGTPVHVIGTHLQSDADPAVPPEPCPFIRSPALELGGAPVRLSQLQEINNWINDKNIPANQIIIIGGDLNVDKQNMDIIEFRYGGREYRGIEYDLMLDALNVDEPRYTGFPSSFEPWYTYDPALNALATDSDPSYFDYLLLRRDHARPNTWYNDVIYAISYPDNWDDGAARGYDYSDHFPVAGYINPAEAPLRMSYGRGSGGELICATNEREELGRCYPQCESGYIGVLNTCTRTCTPISIILGTCTPDIYFVRSTGRPSSCPGGQENYEGLCYPRCERGFTGMGRICFRRSDPTPSPTLTPTPTATPTSTAPPTPPILTPTPTAPPLSLDPDGQNLVLIANDTPLLSAPGGGSTGLRLTTCKTVFIIAISRDGRYGRVRDIGGWISLTAVADIAEDYGQQGGQPIVPQCVGR